MVLFVKMLLLNREVSVTTIIKNNAMTSTVYKIFKIYILLIEVIN